MNIGLCLFSVSHAERDGNCLGDPDFSEAGDTKAWEAGRDFISNWMSSVHSVEGKNFAGGIKNIGDEMRITHGIVDKVKYFIVKFKIVLGHSYN